MKAARTHSTIRARLAFLLPAVLAIALCCALLTGCFDEPYYDNDDWRNQPSSESEMKEYVKSRFPYAGMPETYIDQTLLGKPDECQVDPLERDGEDYHYYIWYTYDGKNMVFTATADQGVVEGVIEQPGPWWNTETGELDRSFEYHSSSSGSTGGTPSGWDAFGVDTYDNGEAFAEDWSQEFEKGDGRGYQDAYNYWLEFHGES